MPVGEIHLGDTGTVFKATIKDSNAAVVDISAATATQFVFYKPNKTRLTVAGAFTSDGTDGLLQYTSVSGDIDQIGSWKLQAFVQTDISHWWNSDIYSFKVYDNLSDF